MSHGLSRNWILKTFVLILPALVGCQSPSPSENQYRSIEPERPLVDEKYRLTADRQKLDEMRAEVPVEQKRANDELSMFLDLVGEVKLPPAQVRSKFDRIAQKKRNQMNKDLTKEREQFTRTERKSREAFLKQFDRERKEYLAKKPTREERQEFFRDQDQKRSEYFSVERDKRSDFESDVRERRRSFEDYIREKTDQFNQEHRSYSKRYDEKKKQEKEAAREKEQAKNGKDENPTEVKAFLEEFMELDSKASTPLESGQ